MKYRSLQPVIETLQLGRYNKGKSRLRYRNNDTYYYCCLGVICDMNGYEWIQYTDTPPIDDTCLHGIIYGVRSKSVGTYSDGINLAGMPIELEEAYGISISPVWDLNDDNDTWEQVCEYFQNLEDTRAANGEIDYDQGSSG